MTPEMFLQVFKEVLLLYEVIRYPRWFPLPRHFQPVCSLYYKALSLLTSLSQPFSGTWLNMMVVTN
jgi:hypothetical protein